MSVTLSAIRKEVTELKQHLLEKPDQQKELDENDVQKIRDTIRIADRTLDAELDLRDVYILTDKRWPVNTLLNNIQNLFANGVFSKLPEITKFDFEEAGKCIVFERPTAAAFHILRGTEGTLRFYYDFAIKRKKQPNPMWAQMIDQLEVRRDTPKPLLDALDNIRFNSRNPTSHPQATHGLDEAQDLFGVCIDAVNQIIREMERKKYIS